MLFNFVKGATVKVFNQKLNGERCFEGFAIIIKVNQGDKQGVHANVHFLNDIGLPEENESAVERWVFASDQYDTVLEKA